MDDAYMLWIGEKFLERVILNLILVEIICFLYLQFYRVLSIKLYSIFPIFESLGVFLLL